ncbi:hypothetical protein ACWV27_25670 (plasmid) [Massilia varians]
MKRRFFLPTVVLFYVYSTSVCASSTCNEFRTDMQAIQQQVRQIEMNRSTSVLDSVQQASQAVKASCLDQLSGLDMTSFGLTPGAASMITKLANQACQKLSQQLAQKMNDVRQKALNGVNSALDGTGLNTSPWAGSGGIQPSTGMSSEPSVAKSATGYVADAWDKIKNFLLP